MARDQKQILTEFHVLQAQSGLEASFRALFGLWDRALRRYIAVKTDDPGAVDEVAQETWISIAKGLPRIEDPACFPRWAFQIASRRSADWVRRRQRERRRAAALQANAADAPVNPPGAPREVNEAEERLRLAIQALPALGREVIHLFYYAEMNVAAIARSLGIPAGTVKSRLFSAREQLKQSL